MEVLLRLYTTFFRIGLVMFGGGYAMLPLLEAEIVNKKKWATQEEILNYFAVGQCTPGIIAVNTATFVGYKQQKIPGAVFATLGMISPSVIIILLIATVLERFADNPWVNHAFAGIRVAVCALIIHSIVKLWKSGIKNKLGILLFLISFVMVAFLGLSAVWIVIGALALGIFLQVLRGRGTNAAEMSADEGEESETCASLKGGDSP